MAVIMDMVNKFKVDADKSALTKFTLLRRAEVPESDSSPVLANRGSMWHVVRAVSTRTKFFKFLVKSIKFIF